MDDAPKIDEVELAEQAERDRKEVEDYLKRSQYGHDVSEGIDTGLGHMGGAGASGTMGPDFGKIPPMPGNSSDLPKP